MMDTFIQEAYTKPHDVVLIFSYKEHLIINEAARQDLLNAWNAYYGRMQECGKVLTKGKCMNQDHMLIVMHVLSDTELQAIIDNDPSLTGGLFEITEVIPFN